MQRVCLISGASTMKITAVRTIPLRGATQDTGWPGGTDAHEQMNTLVEISTDEGLSGLGSCFNSQALVEGSLGLLRPRRRTPFTVPSSTSLGQSVDQGAQLVRSDAVQ
jgi:hypothetical protein